MSRVLAPTVWIGLGAAGPPVVARALAALDGPQPLLAEMSGFEAELGPRFSEILEPLLRAGRAQGALGEPRLDLVAFASVLEGDDGSLVRAMEALAAVIRAQYAVLFPPDRAPEQRTAGLQLVLLVPPLSDGEAARTTYARLAALERWAEGNPAFPLLARVWLVAEQTSAGTLSREEQVASAAAFAVAAFGAGLRDAEAFRARLSHPGLGEGRIGLLSLASLDVPEGPLYRYALERAALDGLSALVARTGRPVADLGLADAAVAKISLETVLRSVREAGASLAPRATAPLSIDAPALGIFEDAEAVRARWPELVRRRTVAGLRSEDIADALDRAEAAAHARLRDALDERVNQALAPAGGLRPLPEVEAGLRRALRTLVAEGGRGTVADKAAEEGSEEDAALATLNEALDALPHPGRLRAAAAAAGLAVGYLSAMLAFAAMAPAGSTAGAALAAPVVGGAPVAAAWQASDVVPWMLGLGIGVVVALVFVRLVGRSARARVQSLLAGRQAALRAPVVPPELTPAVLAARDARLRRIAAVAVGSAVARLEAARQILIGGRDSRQAAMVALGIHPSAEAATDDLRPLHGGGGALHGALVPPEALARWAARCRAVAERERWADQLLEASPGADGDLPCADAGAVERASKAQVAPMASRSVFDDPDVSQAIAETVRRFAARIPLALGAAVTARDAVGDPVAGLRPGAVLTVGPASGRSALAGSLADAPIAVEMLWTPVQAPRLLFLRTWEGFRAAEIARGAGVAGPEGAP